jgi:hypothetical protein
MYIRFADILGYPITISCSDAGRSPRPPAYAILHVVLPLTTLATSVNRVNHLVSDKGIFPGRHAVSFFQSFTGQRIPSFTNIEREVSSLVDLQLLDTLVCRELDGRLEHLNMPTHGVRVLKYQRALGTIDLPVEVALSARVTSRVGHIYDTTSVCELAVDGDLIVRCLRDLSFGVPVLA